jgi:hypothetical protein
VVSRKNAFYHIRDLERPRFELIARIPWGWQECLSHVRLCDRVLKHSILQVHSTLDGRWLVANGHRFWRVDKDGSVSTVSPFSGTRPMSRGICEAHGITYVADYLLNNDRGTVRIHSSEDLIHFRPVWEFTPGQIRHVHALVADPDRNRIWVLTGDEDSESSILYTDDGFGTLELFLNAGQRTRACDVIVSDGRLIWGMDSPAVTSYILSAPLNDPEELTAHRELPGPAYYMCRNAAGALYLGTTVEPGPAVADRFGRVFATDPNGVWEEVHRSRSDFFPQHGIFYFPKGELPENYLVFSRRALVPDEGSLTIARDVAWDR